jgi:adenosine deaminase
MTQNVTIAALPKVVLHDHLDGGVRIDTILELADADGYDALPSTDPAALASWFDQRGSGSLEQYLEAFSHTVGVMQTADAIERVSYEAVIDLHADTVVYAELRFGPALHTRKGLDLESVIEAALSGLDRAGRETGMVTGLLPSALRDHNDSEQVARAAAQFVGRGAVGFDLAGPEAGYPADDHLPAFRVIHDAGLGLTIHAGEGDGLNSIFRAIARCGAHRIGHGVRIVDDTESVDGRIVNLGPLAKRIVDRRIHLEVAVRSNIHTGFVSAPASHPLAALHRAGFSVSINTDNRLMSQVTTGDEYESAAGEQGLTLSEIGAMTEDALRAGFGDWSDRRRLIHEVIRPAYAAAAEAGVRSA